MTSEEIKPKPADFDKIYPQHFDQMTTKLLNRIDKTLTLRILTAVHHLCTRVQATLNSRDNFGS